MDATYSQKQEILKKRGITPATKHHDYDYLYKSVITAMEEYHLAKSKEEAEERYKKAKQSLPDLSEGWVFDDVYKAIHIASGKEKE